MKRLLRFSWLLLLGFSQVHAALPEEEAQAAKALLGKALAYYQSNGDKAFAAFSRQGEFVDHDRYVFVVDTQGVLLASGGPSSALIGRDVSEVLGADLRQSFKDALKAPEGQGIQQADYRWQNWNDGKIEHKHVFYQRVGETHPRGGLLPATGHAGTGASACGTRPSRRWSRMKPAR